MPTGDQALSAARTALLTAATPPADASPTTTTDDQPASQQTGRKPQRLRTRWLAAAAAVVALTAGAVVVVQSIGPGNSPQRGKLTAAAQVLKRAASNITVKGDLKVADGQYRYLRNRSWGSASSSSDRAPGKFFVYRSEYIEETWIPADETDDWLKDVDHTGRTEWIVGTEEEAAELEILPPNEDSYDYRGKSPCGGHDVVDGRCAGRWSEPSPSWSESLPQDAHGMLKRLRAAAAEDGDDATVGLDANALMTVAQALNRGLATASGEIRSAVYRALAMMPDIEVTEDQANLDGRQGIALGMPAGDHRFDIIVDPDTGEYIGSRRVQTKTSSGIKPGTVLDYNSVTTAVVDEMGQRPSK